MMLSLPEVTMVLPSLRKAVSHRRLALLLLPSLLVAGVLPASGTEVKIHRNETMEERLDGEIDRLALVEDGRLLLARELKEVASLEEPFVFSAARRPEGGWILGTGSEGRVVAVGADGSIGTLVQLEEPQVFAVAAGKKDLFAAASPDGTVVRIDAATAEDIFDPEATYVWDLAVDGRGRVIVGTGLPGRVWRLGRTGEQAEMLWESPDGHVRAVLPMADGSIVAGTAGEGRIVRIDERGGVTTLLDAEMPEVVALAASSEGRIFAALAASEASQVDLSGANGGEAEGEGVTVVAQNGETIGSRAGGFEGPRSRVLEIRGGGRTDEVASFEDATVHALAWWNGQLWMGTGEEGQLWRHDGTELVLEHDLEPRQIVALVPGSDGVAVATTDLASLNVLGDRPVESGRFTSAVIDAGATSRFGAWSARDGGTEGVSVRLRSGLSAIPDGTWTDWTEAGKGAEVSAAALSAGRYAQWEVTLTSSGDRNRLLGRVELTSRQVNVAPTVSTFGVLDPGEILVPSSFNPQNQTYEPWSPNREGIFERLRPEGSSGTNGTKSLYKHGWRTLQWKAEDPNGDDLRYRLSFRPEDGSDGDWLGMAEEVDQSWHSFDATALPSGVYRFRLEASDEAQNALGEGEITTKETPATVVDHAPPTVKSVRRSGGVWMVEVADDLSPIRQAEVSLDASMWRPVTSSDGLVDGRTERLRVEVPEGTRYVLLRLIDASLNTVTVDLGAL